MSVTGVSDAVDYGDCEMSKIPENQLKSILKHAQDAGKVVGLVTNTRITHATPASAYAHSASRYWESDADLEDDRCDDIAHQLIHDPYSRHFNVIFGGGRSAFFPNTTPDAEYPDLMGVRQDARDLIQEWIDLKQTEGLAEGSYRYVWNQEGIDDLEPENVDYVLGLFEPYHMQFESDRDGEPSLPEMVRKAISILQKNPIGFLLIVEGGRIDHGHHETRAFQALHETVIFDDAVQVAMEMTDEEDTLLVVTADHSHVFTISGYPTLHNDILDVSDNVDGPDWALDMSGKRWLTVGYTNGPGFFDHRYNMTGVDDEPLEASEFEDEREFLRLDPILMNIDPNDPDLRQDAPIPLYSETHGGEDVGIYARGPMAHLFHGTHEQNYIAHVCMYAACIGPNTDHCTIDDAERGLAVPFVHRGVTDNGQLTLVIGFCLSTVMLF